jgi:RNA 2',3'-cyclic 3'-phosphodiesterase
MAFEKKRSLFFAFLVPAELGSVAQNLATTHIRAQGLLRARPLGVGRHHVTLCTVWDSTEPPPSALMEVSQRVGQSVSAGATNFEIAFDQITGVERSFATANLLFLHARSGPVDSALRSFHRHLLTSLRQQRVKVDGRFSPHVSLAYYAHGITVATQTVREFRWPVSELVLIDSRVGDTRYDFVGRWPLVHTAPANSTPLVEAPQRSLF